MITRKPNWEKLLNATIAELAGKPFSRGVTDCVMTVSDVVLAFTGKDLAEDHRGSYLTDFEASKRILKMGGLEEMFRQMAQKFELPEISPKMAQRGDLAYIDFNAEHQGAGLFISAGIMTFAKPGIQVLPRRAAKLAWRIG